MTLFYILIKDLKNKKNLIYNSTPISEKHYISEVETCFRNIQKKHQDQMLFIKHSDNTNVDTVIYSEHVVKKQNWIWSSTERIVTNLYELHKVPLFELPLSECDSSEHSEMSDSFESKKSFFTFGTGYSNSILSPFGNNNHKVYMN